MTRHAFRNGALQDAARSTLDVESKGVTLVVERPTWFTAQTHTIRPVTESAVAGSG